ncbi:type 4a pilus biogenesis protein PilO [Ferrimonas lipolytica]|uniref:Type 4a pilus biogenesis protein PilO n=1 Tax=Ferrimonas lipolytica TaxID=2724191 RepID=A0A6H1UJW2_9GAMM|nr:type 4a pilus biogenesis protein PilO [Ferrimonas lipolytica]QIZ78506.1 type 4a pilus biogenesis protein PilO [Ferrimonas lipolytica]
MDFNQINELELENVGSWPKPAKVVLALVMVVLLGVLGYYAVIQDSIKQLDNLKTKEVELKNEFERKYKLAANLPKYREQLALMEQQFSDLLTMLPTATEMPGLLDSVTYLATDSSLQIQSLNWRPEGKKEFYVEMPIEMKLTGGYHDFGSFASGVAGLPRIVSLHDFTMVRSDDELLQMSVTAKTYRFSEPKPENAKGAK